MKTQLTKWQLFAMLSARNKPVTINGVTGYLHAIAREDGSGSSFNVSLSVENGRKNERVYVRTID